RGVPQVEVTFDIDANGIVHVAAKDLGTNKEQSIKITASSGLSKDEIDKMVKEAQAHSEEDKRRKESAEARNEADTTIYGVEKSLKEFGEKLSDADRNDINEKIAETKKAVESNDATAIRAAVAALSTASHKLAEEMYKKTAASTASGTGPQGGDGSPESDKPKDDNVVDAVYEEVDKEKK
ncbi:MAG: Hsp70 family protein, partial [Nitrospiria bacterium]